MSPKVIALDVDDVCADLLSEWLRLYNLDYNDNLLPENIWDWDLSKCVKPVCGRSIYKYLHKANLYDGVKPFEGAREAVYTLLSKGHRVVYVTACVQDTMDQKLEWLLHHCFLTKKNYRRDFIAAGDKSLIMADYLFDDRPLNVETFKWGTGVLVERPHNRDCKWPHRVRSLAEAPNWLGL